MLKNDEKIKTYNSKRFFGLLFNVFLIGMMFSSFLSFAANTANITQALISLKDIVCQFFGALIMVCIVLAAIAYAAGNVMGAEAGARAKVWATNLIIGAALGVVLYIVAPLVLGALAGKSLTGCS
jgi:cellulose synthase/poly-beta-1,6-N-acetylglucosamine synthase-like glycosyltransferase